MATPSFMALIALGFTEFGTVSYVLKEAFGNSTVFYVIAMLMLSQMLQTSGLTTKLIETLISKNFVKGRPWALSFIFMLTAYVASIFVNAVPPCIIL